MTREEYKRNLLRMFDSLRTEYKGKRNCDGIECNNCPFNGKVCYAGERLFRAYDAIEIVETVENWAKEHPIKTNADKFKEVFGLDMAPIHSCVSSKSCEDCEYTYDGACAVSKLFWDAEYKEQTEE